MRYRALNPYLREKFGEKVYKISIRADVSCPNRDGSVGQEGCIYCNPASGLPKPLENNNPPIDDQIRDGMAYMRGRHNAHKFIAYFQQFSNTYAPTPKLKEWFSRAIQHPDVVGLAVSTRPDCISDDAISLLNNLNHETFLWTELGLQSANDEILRFLNRGHTVDDFIETTNKLTALDIPVCAHVILGLPHETDNELIQMAALLNELRIWGIKIHNLHILKNTPLQELYYNGKVELLSLDHYAKRAVFFLEHLHPDIVIHRFNSHAPEHATIAPKWSINKLATFNAIENELERQNTWQGNKL